MITQDNLCLHRAVKYITHKTDKSSPFVIFDVGSNIGDYIELLNSMVQANFVVHSFEPNPKAFERLNERYGTQPNVTLNNVGVSSSEHKMDLYDPGSVGSAIASLYNRKAYEGFKPEDQPVPVEVSLISIDSYVSKNNITQINYLKIDVEGHELEALKGAVNTFQSGIVNAGQFEIGDTFKDAGISIDDFVKFFDSFGYSIFYGDVAPGNIVKTASDVVSVDNWENLLFIKNELLVKN